MPRRFRMPRAPSLIGSVLLGAFLGTLLPTPGVAQDFDIVIRGGRVLDGGVAGSTIRVGDGSRQRQWKTLPATWLTPPFARISLRTANISSA